MGNGQEGRGGNERWQEGGTKWEDDQEREQFVSPNSADLQSPSAFNKSV